MCELCKDYGDPGVADGVWYLNPKNYARSMYKLRMPGEVPKANKTGGGGRASLGPQDLLGAIEKGDQATYYKTVEAIREAQKKTAISGGQVVPLLESDEVIKLSYPLGLMHCGCRKMVRGALERNEHEYTCLGLGEGMLKWERWPEEYKGGVKLVSTEEAIAWNHMMDKRGYVHYVMFYDTPFIGGFCQ